MANKYMDRFRNILFQNNRNPFENNKGKMDENNINFFKFQHNIFDIRIGKYSDVYFWSIMNKITNGLNNIRFTCNQNKADVLVDFAQKNLNNMVWEYWSKGVIVVDFTDMNNITLVDKFNYNTDGSVSVPMGKDWSCFYSEYYLHKQKTHFMVIQDLLCRIDKYVSSDDYLSTTFGAVGLLTGKELPLLNKDKKEFLDSMKDSLGIDKKGYQFLISSGTVDFKQIDLKIAELQLPQKVKDLVLDLADFFGVPHNLINLSGNSTYANQQQALRDFYSGCISPLAEVVLTVVRDILRRSTIMVPISELSYEVDNVPEIKEDIVGQIEVINKLMELANSTIDEEVSAHLNELIKIKTLNLQ